MERADFPLGLRGIQGEESESEMKFGRLKSLIKAKARSQVGRNPWVTRPDRCSSNINSAD